MYGSGRKIGVGFNQPRVIGERMRCYSHRGRYALMARMVRHDRTRDRVFKPLPAASLVEMHRQYFEEFNNRPKRRA